jgi:hypothetical protein
MGVPAGLTVSRMGIPSEDHGGRRAPPGFRRLVGSLLGRQGVGLAVEHLPQVEVVDHPVLAVGDQRQVRNVACAMPLD